MGILQGFEIQISYNFCDAKKARPRSRDNLSCDVRLFALCEKEKGAKQKSEMAEAQPAQPKKKKGG